MLVDGLLSSYNPDGAQSLLGVSSFIWSTIILLLIHLHIFHGYYWCFIEELLCMFWLFIRMCTCAHFYFFFVHLLCVCVCVFEALWIRLFVWNASCIVAWKACWNVEMFVESLLAHCSTVMLILSPRPCFYAFFLLLVNNYLLSVHICSW